MSAGASARAGRRGGLVGVAGLGVDGELSDVDLRALEGRADAMRKMPKPTFRAPSALPDYLGMRVRSHSSSRRAIAWSKACIRQCTGTIGWVLIAGRPTGSALRDYVLFAGGVSGIILLALDAGPSREMIRKRSPAEAEAIQASADGAEPM